MFSEIGLLIWSAFGLAWSFLSWRLVAQHRPLSPAGKCPAASDSISIFKPLPPLGEKAFAPYAAGLESFFSQLGERDELLLGVHPQDEKVAATFGEQMKARHPAGHLKIVTRSEPDSVPNPKIAWQKIIALQAGGDLWLWSDADIVAPPGYIESARIKFQKNGVRMLTSPYVVREMHGSPALLDALFVNVEFYPGVLLLRRIGPVHFGFGAGMLFRRHDFESTVDWNKIGSALADDFALGQILGPVRIGTALLTTQASESTWRGAALHYLRWSKTVRWNQPRGTAARIMVLPILGWLVYCAFHPAALFGWLGLIMMMQMEVLFAVLIFRKIGCPLRPRDGWTLEAWTLWRCFVWLAIWLPWPVFWGNQKWTSSYLSDDN